ncbi:MAG: transporter substrate-binding domain-containing protein [Pseudomonadota bacterium]
MRKSVLLTLCLWIACAEAAFADTRLRFVTLDFAPFSYLEDGIVAGPGRELVDDICERIAIECSFDAVPWRRALELMRSDAVDAMMPIGFNEDRARWLDYSPPMFATEYGFFVSASNPLDYSDVSQIAGMKIGVLAPSNSERLLMSLREALIERDETPIIIERHAKDELGMRKLAAGRLDAVFINQDRGWGLIDMERLGPKIRYAGDETETVFYTAIRKTYPNADLVEDFFDAWRGLYDQGKAQRIIRAFGLDPAPAE